MSLVVLDGVQLSFGPQKVLDSLDLRVGDRDRIGLIGPNGSGKTTLLRVLAGEQAVDGGAVQRARRVRIGYLPQDITVTGGRGLLEFVLSSVPGRDELDRELARAEEELEAAQERADEGELMQAAERIADTHERIDHFEQFFAEHQAMRILAGLGFRADERDRDIAELSGGWKMRAVLASLLFQQPDLLLLDEPTNHLDMPSVSWLSGFLQRYDRAFILISHDREFLNEQISRVVSFEPEGVRQYSGDYERYVKQREEEEQVLANKAKNQERERERMERFVERFRAQANKARQAQSKAKQLARMEEVEVVPTRKVMRIRFGNVKRTVNEVVRIEGLRKAFGDHVVLSDVDLFVQRGEKIGIIGPNGAGKTTLLKMIAGELDKDEGKIAIGSDVEVGYYAQHHAEALNPAATVYEEVARVDPDSSQTRVRSVLGAFLFGADDIDKPISVLSGGERARVALARLLIKPGTLLLMDEPTNHLDLQSSDALAESLADFGGTVVFVSHNRSLVRALANKIWNLEDGSVETYPGTLDEYMESCRRRLDAASRESAEPKKPEPASRRGGDKERKRLEAERRQERSRVIAPIEERIDDLGARISELERARDEHSARLADPDVYADAARRNQLLGEFQKTEDKIAELTARWEAAVEELDRAEAELDGRLAPAPSSPRRGR